MMIATSHYFLYEIKPEKPKPAHVSEMKIGQIGKLLHPNHFGAVVMKCKSDNTAQHFIVCLDNPAIVYTHDEYGTPENNPDFAVELFTTGTKLILEVR